MDVGAIVIVEAESGGVDGSPDLSVQNVPAGLADGPLSFLDLLGQSMLERTVEYFSAAQAKATSLLVDKGMLPCLPGFRSPIASLTVRVAEDVWAAVAQILKGYSDDGIRCAFLAKASAYVEADLSDLLEFHSEGDRSVTRACDGEGLLDLWMVDCETEGQKNGAALKSALTDPDFLPASYFVRRYVKRIRQVRDCRQLVTDALLSRCGIRPFGSQIRPGVWSDESVDVRRGARIVGPAYLGKSSVIGEGALVTRCSNIESGSFIDYGTAIEDSSVLSNTYVGMWLDVRHSVIQANKLLNLEREVLVEISDPTLLRSNPVPGKTSSRPLVVPDTSQARRSLAASETYRKNVQPVKTSTEFES